MLFRSSRAPAIQGEVREISSHHAAIFELPVRVGGIQLSLIYSLNTHGPALSIAARFSNQKEVIVRNLVLRVEIKNIDEKSILNIPGNGLRSNLTVSTLTESAGISPLGGLRGSSSTIHLSDSINSFWNFDIIINPCNERINRI